MSRSERAEREERKYSSARAMVDKMGTGFSATYLKLPEGVKIYKPKVGTALLDIVPYVTAEGNPNADEGVLHWERTFWVHRGIGANSETFLCPAKNFKKKCPICEHRMTLLQEDDEESEKARKALAPKERQLFNVLDRKEPDKGIQLMDQSSFAFGQVLLEEGYTLKVVWEEDTIGRGQKFIKAQSIDFKERKDPLDDRDVDEAACLDECIIETPYDELKDMFIKGADEEKPRRSREREPEAEEPPARRRSREPEEKEPEERERRRSSREPEAEEPPARRRREEPADDEKPRRGAKDPDDWGDDNKKEEKDEKPARRSREPDDEKPRGKEDKEKEADWEAFDEKPRRSREREPEPEERPARSRSKRED